jgi:RHS repeat-associated protein
MAGPETFMYRLIFKLLALLAVAVPAAGRFVPSPGPDPSPARRSIHAIRLANPFTVQPRVSAGTSAISVSLQEVNPGAVVERGLCLSIAVGEGAAAECGDLRLVHPLAAMRTLNKLRTPVLLYGSATAHPHPLVAADVVLPRGSTGLLRVVGSLFINGKLRARSAWSGSHWPASGAARIALGFDALNDATNLYRDSLLVEAYYTGTGGESADTGGVSGDLAIVNRAHSPFGAGWWLAGYEQLLLSRWGEPVLWVGGDGSVLPYTKVADSVWVAPNPSRPDTLKRVGSGFLRFLPGGVRVAFDERGRDTATIDRLGHRTRFHYRDDDLLGSVILPLPGSADTTARYALSYAGGKLQRVDAPGPTQASPRTTTLHRTGVRVDSITDPDSTVVAFGYTDASARVASRTNRMGTVTDFRYDAGGKLSGSTVEMQGTGDDIITTLWAQESVGLADTLGTGAGAVDTSLVYTLLDGPRTDVADTTRFWLDRFGAPRVIHDALGHETVLERNDSQFPALVTRVEYPQLADGRQPVVTATYDGRGNLKTSTVVDPYDDGRNATTRYERTDPHWPDFVTRVVPPGAQEGVSPRMGDSTVIAYDSVTGNRLWQQPGSDESRRVVFGYSPATPSLLEQVEQPTFSGTAVEGYEYDPLGNLAAVVSPLGIRTESLNDGIGRTIRVRHPLDAGAAAPLQKGSSTQDSTVYDGMGRVLWTESYGPPYNGVPEQRLVVETAYDDEGNPLSVSRSSSPDTSHIGVVTTRWAYDRAGRVVRETAPDLEVDSTVYDPAGNPTHVLTRRTDPTSGARIEISMQYDALNRLTSRSLPEVHYGSRYAGIPYQYGTGVGTCSTSVLEFQRTYPSQPNDGACGYRIPADVQTFGYDALGNLIIADNADTQIRRSYYTNGRIETDSLRIRTTDGNDFSSHAYGLAYHYDLDGRRTQLDHPTQLAPSPMQNRTSYAYDPLTGALDTVTDALGNEYDYLYDPRGLVHWIELPGDVLDSYVFDLDGNLETHETVASQRVRGSTFTYDARGKLLDLENLSGTRDTLSFGYSGLGALVMGESARHPVVSDPTKRETGSEAYGYDALGNIATSHTMRMPPGVNATQQTRTPEYDHTGRLLASQNWRRIPYDGAFREIQDREYRLYDEAGNELFRSQYYGWYGVAGSCDSESKDEADCEDRASYYAADGRLRAAEHRTRAGTDGLDRWDVTFEEYRYDALGRRVWVRSRGECGGRELVGGPASCQSTLRRTVWDGDQELYEIQMPGDSGSLYLENDTALIPVRSYRAAWPVLGTNDFFAYDPNASFGRVLYTNGLGVDRPLGLVRMDLQRYWPSAPPGTGGQATTFSTFSITPLWNWRGEADAARFADGSTDRCQTFSSGTYCISVSDTTGGAWGAYQPGGPFGAGLVHDWYGTLLTGKQDATGTLYRRARYYDPQTGRFTQEDPIGLAGGLNLYGYAGGDPVNLSDPAGTCPWCIGGAIGAIGGAVVGAGIYHFTTPPGQRSALGYLKFAAGGAVGGAVVGAGVGFAAEALGLVGGGSAAGGTVGDISVVSFEGAGAAEGSATELQLTKTVANHAASRPYVNSELLAREIMSTGRGVADPGGVATALRWDVPGAFNGTEGIWELVVDQRINTILHFLFKSVK